ncbi:MAG: MFS transporter [Pirellulales bacterium]|nr:MFS transporter [Pirellulales bacterium]
MPPTNDTEIPGGSDISRMPEGRRTHYRWVVCGLLFLATTINYVDRQVIGILAPTLEDEFGWTATHYSYIIGAFSIAYGISYMTAGWLMDRIGERRGFLLVVFVWSLAAMAHGLVQPLVYSGLPWMTATFAGTFLGALTPATLSMAGFIAARFALGLAEGGNFPGAVRTVSLWHPKRERALSTGIFNSGSNMGVLLAACAVPLIVEKLGWGWPVAFYVTGALGFLWLALWFFMYRRPEEHPRVSPAELEHIRSDPADPPAKVSWISLLRYRQTWAHVLGCSLVGPVWWFYLFWTTLFLKDRHGIGLSDMLGPLVVIYLMADMGSIGGGGLSSWLIRRGASVNVARKVAFLVCALCVVPVISVVWVDNMWVAVVLIGLAAAAHQGFSANLYTIVSDTVPRKAVGSVVGLGGTASCIAMVGFSTLIGAVLDWTEHFYGRREYLIPFVIAGSNYLIAVAVIHLLLPRLEPMTLDMDVEVNR